jgi:6-phosphogluconolactonase
MSRTIMAVGALTRVAPHFPQAHGKGLRLYDFDETNGSAVLLCETEGIDNPSYLSITPDGRFLYANSEVFGWPEGTVSAYRVDLTARRLLSINKQASLGSTAVHSCFDQTGRFLLVANYGIGPMDEGPNQAIVVYPIREDGGLGPAVSSVAHAGTGPDPERQERPHPHCVAVAPDNRFVVVADLGLDSLFSYPFAQDGRMDSHGRVRCALPSGSGPRHLAFHGSGRLAAVICELDSTIVSLRYFPETGRFEILNVVSAVPEGFGESRCSGIQMHPSGRFAYGANRGHDSIAVLRLDPDSGRLTPAGHTPCRGATPRDIAIDPSGRFLAVCNQNGDRICVFAIDGDSGALSPTQGDIEVGTPMCVKFARVAR